MNILSRKQFINSKKHDTLCIMGCGYSINNISDKKWKFVQESTDQFTVNWFCLGKTPIIPTYYLIDEQGTNRIKAKNDTTHKDFINHLKCRVAIVKDRKNSSDAFRYAEHLEDIKFDGVITYNSAKVGSICNCKDVDVLSDGFVFMNGCMSNAFHFAVWMKYKTVIFIGVDLYDSRYYWMPYDEEWSVIRRSGININTRHGQANNFINMAREAKGEFKDMIWMVENNQSLLAEVIPVWDY